MDMARVRSKKKVMVVTLGIVTATSILLSSAIPSF
jgi:hypothetical protein